MEPTVQKNTLKTIIIGAAALIVLILSTGFLAFALMISSETKVFDGVYVNDINIGGMSQDVARETLLNEYGESLEGKNMRLSYGGSICDVPMDEIGAVPDIESTVQKAYDIGRQGNVFKNMQNVLLMRFQEKQIVLDVTYDEEKLHEIVVNFVNGIEAEHNAFEVDEERKVVRIATQSTGQLVDTMATQEAVLNRIGKMDFSDLEPIFATDSDSNSRARILAEKIQREPKDAYAIVGEDGRNIAVAPEQSGINVDADEIEGALKKGDKDFEVPIEITPAKVNQKELEAVLMVNLLSEFTTNYDASIIGRTQNVAQAAKNIDGYILAPGEVFSFNEVVGERTVGNGFAIGQVFVGNRIVDGIGGGICQVSSTLYNVALLADMEITERHNHTFIVSYVPMGQDATVAYGALDFQFRNNTEYPVRLETVIGGGRLTVRLYGTAREESKTVKIINTTIATRAFGITEQPNPNPTDMRRIITQSGNIGATVDTYKAYYEGEVEIDRIFLHRSVYSPLNQIVLVPAQVEEGDVEEQIMLPQEPIDQGDILEE